MKKTYQHPDVEQLLAMTELTLLAGSEPEVYHGAFGAREMQEVETEDDPDLPAYGWD